MSSDDVMGVDQSNSTHRFAAQAQSAEDVLQEQTIGLVHLSDFRKRRAEAFDQNGNDSNTGSEGRKPSQKAVAFKKKAKLVRKGGLSFGDEEEDQDDQKSSNISKMKSSKHLSRLDEAKESFADTAASSADEIMVKKRLKANANVAFQPKSNSKAALAKEAQTKEELKKEYLRVQEAVRLTDFILPFVFFDGKDHAAGKVRMKKGDHLWLFLERARKVGAEHAAASNGVRNKDWARISVDDLMFVKQDLILPPHYDFHYFILNRSVGYHGQMFNLSAEPTAATPAQLLSTDQQQGPDTTQAGLVTSLDGLSNPSKPDIADSALEGFLDDASLTKVVDRRWYERNKHIFPASIWEGFDAERDYSVGGRKDREGNQMFFSR